MARFAVEERSEEITRVGDFVSLVIKLRETPEVGNRKLLYRGVADKVNHHLIPSIARLQRYAGKDPPTYNLRLEKHLLHRFRRRAYPLVERSLTAGEAIFLARHHGLPTRLLDWTANALFALYFACRAHEGENGRVWAMLRNDEDKYDLDAFELAERQSEDELLELPIMHKMPGYAPDDSDRYAVKIVHPVYNSPRVLAQDGAFTIHSDPQKRLDQLQHNSFADHNLDIKKLYCWSVSAEDKGKQRIIEELSGLGITERLVYPDLDGGRVARVVENWRWRNLLMLNPMTGG
jgi:hypothetical protein